MSDLYEDLGVPKDADKDTIRKAYRKKAQQEHPDRDGGDAEKFHKITVAYKILKDDARRAQYDKTGQTTQEDLLNILHQRLAALFLQQIERDDADCFDIIGQMRQQIQGGMMGTTQQIMVFETKIKKYLGAKNRLKKKGKADNILMAILDGQISANRRMIESAKADIEKQQEMLKMLVDYTWDYNPHGMHTFKNGMSMRVNFG